MCHKNVTDVTKVWQNMSQKCDMVLEKNSEWYKISISPKRNLGGARLPNSRLGCYRVGAIYILSILMHGFKIENCV